MAESLFINKLTLLFAFLITEFYEAGSGNTEWKKKRFYSALPPF